ncbi:MAG: thioredoxin domain-containing protein [Chthoniobacterales bacterium]|nr:thioredoxin domain-containing protein [Chthoniobacterales bacterium]
MNHLIDSSSLYLQEHSSNPVEWYPWGEEAFTRARLEQKPIFLSIGYSTCHWCHVMAHESFENREIAVILNTHFICIKVDREERPDVDRLYMTYVQAFTGGGGWPMSVWLTPELKPFFGGTYFPPQNASGRIGFPSVLLQLAQLWKENRKQLEEEAIRTMQVLEQSVKKESALSVIEKEIPLQRAYEQFSKSFDAAWGGFGMAPKFPRPSVLFFLLRYAHTHQNEQGEHACQMALYTLRKMASGGLHDQLGGGFHRYSVDRFWQVPHFEKMLYDQAQLAMAYLEAYQILSFDSNKIANDCGVPKLDRSTPSSSSYLEYPKNEFSFSAHEYAEVVHSILSYVKRDMASHEGGFYCAEDADSINSMGIKSEGAFYVWSMKEIEILLTPEEFSLMKQYYKLSEEGNVPKELDPHGELQGKNILILHEDQNQIDENKELLACAQKKLFQAREKRLRPLRDDKILTAWNGLMISAYARAGAAFDSQDYTDTALHAALFIRKHLYNAASQELSRSWRQGQIGEQGFAEDYAFLIQGLLDLYEATFDITWLQWAKTLQKKMDALFWDADHGGYFSSPEGDPHLLLRIKEDYDGAEPSANSVAALNQLRFSRMLHDSSAMQKAEEIFNLSSLSLEGMPTALPQLLVALWYSLTPLRQLVVAGELAWADTQLLLVKARKGFHPEQIVMLAEGDVGQEWLAARKVELSEMKPEEGKAVLYRCENFCCEQITL